MFKISTPLCVISALVFAVTIGWVDLHSAEVQWSVLFLLLFSCLLGLASPGAAWLWAAIVGLSVPAAHLLARLTGISPIVPPTHFGWTFLALIPAYVGASTGAIVRVLWNSVQHRLE